MSGREDEGDERSREEHLDDANVSVIAAEDAGEGICVEDAKTFGCTYSPAQTDQSDLTPGSWRC